MNERELNESLPGSDRFAVQYQLEIELKMTLTTLKIIAFCRPTIAISPQWQACQN